MEEPIAAALFGSGVYEPDTLAAILSRLPADGIYVDVGANVGAIALPVAAQRPGAKVVCVEAAPEIAVILRRNVEENARSNIAVVECVAGSEENPISFYGAPASKFGMGSIGPQFDALPLTLEQRTLDGVLDELGIGNVDVVKLDIEGAELGALRGIMRRLTSSHRPAIVFEFSDWAEARVGGQKPGDAQAYLVSIGYRLFRLGRGGLPGPALDSPITSGSGMILGVPLKS
ncbi:MAG: FkbM family methyltransferase [Rhizomicrobium sp.]